MTTTNLDEIKRIGTEEMKKIKAFFEVINKHEQSPEILKELNKYYIDMITCALPPAPKDVYYNHQHYPKGYIYREYFGTDSGRLPPFAGVYEYPPDWNPNIYISEILVNGEVGFITYFNTKQNSIQIKRYRDDNNNSDKPDSSLEFRFDNDKNMIDAVVTIGQEPEDLSTDEANNLQSVSTYAGTMLEEVNNLAKVQ